jgi:hypothetical protein
MDCRFLDSGTYYAIVDGTDTADWTLAVTACPCEPYGTLQAPGTISGNTCGYDMGCEPFVGDFQDIAVRIPWDGQYTFSFCDPDPDNWDSEFGITADCCSDNFFAYSDNGCEYLNGHGRRACVALVRGTYYVVIGPRQSQCGSWTLNVTACTAAATVDSLVILALPPNIQLSWFSFGGEVNYNIYRGDSANFAITPANLIGATTASSYVDSGAINTAQLAYYYAVTATTP